MKKTVFVLVVWICLLSIFGDLKAREIRMRDYAILGSDFTWIIAAKTILDTMKNAKENDTLIIKDLNVHISIFGDLAKDSADSMTFDLKRNGIDNVLCKLYFNNTVFNSIVNFDSVVFNETVRFTLTKFKYPVTSRKTTFNKDISFNSCTFEMISLFDNSIFLGIADFSLSTFAGFVFFQKCTFKNVSIMHSNFREFVFFDSSVFDSSLHDSLAFGTILNFYGSDFSRNLSFKNISCHDSVKFEFDEAEFARIVVDWSQIQDNLTRSEGEVGLIKTYISFENSFRQQGLFEDMNDCYYDRRQLEYKLQTDGEKIWNWIFDFVCGYSVKPLKVWQPFLFVIFLFTVIFRIMGVKLIDIDYTPVKAYRRWYNKLGDALLFSVLSFLTAGLGSWKAESEKRKLLFTFAAIEGLCGWFILAMFIISLARVYIR